VDQCVSRARALLQQFRFVFACLSALPRSGLMTGSIFSEIDRYHPFAEKVSWRGQASFRSVALRGDCALNCMRLSAKINNQDFA
jgi:hypothetical protein